MRKALVILISAVMLSACADSPKQLIKRADELCRYIPDHELLEKSRDFMTADFYAVLDTMFYRLPAHEAMDHEWLYYFVTGNGGTIADFTVTGVEKTDKTHATATVSVRQKWELFGSHYDIYQNMHSNQDVREAVRREQLGEYVRFHNISVYYYKDYGWDAVKL
ncbi:MAG: hypothetical protein MJY68_05365 [Bacteroidaceae bacterium]|nr:hypothetical protein [Bacteroidaceae bacterium]